MMDQKVTAADRADRAHPGAPAEPSDPADAAGPAGPDNRIDAAAERPGAFPGVGMAPPLDFAGYLALVQLYADYSAALDSGNWAAWPDFFTDPCLYRLQPRENHERGFPLATLSFESQGMLKDRVYGIQETLFHDPYYQRHVVSAPLIRRIEADGRLHCEVNYAVFRTRLSKETTVFNVGRAIDEIVPTNEGLRFASRLLVYDSEMVPNSLIYPL